MIGLSESISILVTTYDSLYSTLIGLPRSISVLQVKTPTTMLQCKESKQLSSKATLESPQPVAASGAP